MRSSATGCPVASSSGGRPFKHGIQHGRWRRRFRSRIGEFAVHVWRNWEWGRGFEDHRCQGGRDSFWVPSGEWKRFHTKKFLLVQHLCLLLSYFFLFFWSLVSSRTLIIFWWLLQSPNLCLLVFLQIKSTWWTSSLFVKYPSLIGRSFLLTKTNLHFEQTVQRWANIFFRFSKHSELEKNKPSVELKRCLEVENRMRSVWRMMNYNCLLGYDYSSPGDSTFDLQYV